MGRSREACRRRFLIETVGSHGDAIPFVEVARELQVRGHDVRLFGNDKFGRLARAKGVAFHATSSEAEADAYLSDPRATDSRQGLRMVAGGLMSNVEHALGVLNAEMGRDSVLVGSTFAFASRLAAQVHRRPFVPIHLAPSIYRSEYLAPRVSALGHFEAWPRWIKRATWAFMDRRFLDPIFCAPLNEIRARHALPPVARVLHAWIHEGALGIAAFPGWFAPRQPDWPENLKLTSFPLPRVADEPPLSEALEAFVSQGEAPIVFTAGTANTSSQSFYAESVAACALLGRRGVLVAQKREQLPRDLPPNVIHSAFTSFARLFPRAAAVVHHGGIGTLSQALAAGVPQLIQPMAYDQFDNASRAHRLGLAGEVLPRRYLANTVARKLQELLHSPSIASACANNRERLARISGVAEICDLLERVDWL